MIEHIVLDCIRKHKGGQAFFNELDDRIRDDVIIDTLFKEYPISGNLVVTGKFGIHLLIWANKINYNGKIIVYNGGLRYPEITDQKPTIVYTYGGILRSNDRYTFIDDSVYSGITRDIIKRDLELYQCSISDSFVIYNGSKKWGIRDIKALYKYYKL